MTIPEQILCNQVKILDLLQNTLGLTPTTSNNPSNGIGYRIEWVSEELVVLGVTASILTVPASSTYCEIEVRGSGTVLKRIDSTPTLERSNQFNQDDLFGLTSRSEMLRSKFISTSTNSLYVNYFKLVLDI